jgi:hypothetical protein
MVGGPGPLHAGRGRRKGKVVVTKIGGGCHCGAVRFEAEVSDPVELLDCRCSICAKTSYLHLIVSHEDFRLLSDPAMLSSYRFGTRTAEHLFCARCGIKSFYQPRSHPDAWSLSYRALDPGHGLTARITPFDRWQ